MHIVPASMSYFTVNCASLPQAVIGNPLVTKAVATIRDAFCSGQSGSVAGVPVGQTFSALGKPIAQHVPSYVCGLQNVVTPGLTRAGTVIPFMVMDGRKVVSLPPEAANQVQMIFGEVLDLSGSDVTVAADWLVACKQAAQQALPHSRRLIEWAPLVGCGLVTLAALYGACRTYSHSQKSPVPVQEEPSDSSVDPIELNWHFPDGHPN
jgi:hypothetical protein